MTLHFSLALLRREFLGGMIGAVAWNGLPGSAFGFGGIAEKAHPFVVYQFPKDFLCGAATASYQIPAHERRLQSRIRTDPGWTSPIAAERTA